MKVSFPVTCIGVFSVISSERTWNSWRYTLCYRFCSSQCCV